MKIEKKCEFCGRPFIISVARRKSQKYCSIKCCNNDKVGKPRAQESIEKTRASLKLYYKTHSGPLKGRKFTKEHLNNLKLSRKKQKNYPCKESAKLKLRLKTVRRLNSLYGVSGWHPGYNSAACEWFKEFDLLNNTTGKYATNGGEHYVEGLGYWVDYINYELKLIIEWDEKKHHYKNSSLVEKNIKRQLAIQKAFYGYMFFRIRESDELLPFALRYT